MNWIKAHLPIVVCGAVSVAAITLIALGIFLSSVNETLAQDAGIVQSLRSAQPVNDRVIQQLARTLDAQTKKLDAVQKRLAELGTYQPLHADVFPDVNPNNRGARFLFKTMVAEAARKMVAELNGGHEPTQAEIALEAAEMADEKAKAVRAESLGVGGAGTPSTPRPGSFFTPGAAPGATPTPGFASVADRARNLPPEKLAEEYPDVRLAIRRARGIYCYVGAEELTFGKWPEVTAVSTPTVDAMWYAQMGLWIEQDVVRAIAGLNNRVAEALKARQQTPWVGNLPVKHLKQIAINEYVIAASVSSTGGSAPPPGGGAPGARSVSFSNQVSSPAIDVISFSVSLVVDARMLPAVIDELCKAGFFTPVLVNYNVEPPNLTFTRYIYGPSPTISVSIDFEGSFLRPKYEKWMPPTVKTAITAGQARFAQGLATGSGGPAGMTPAPVTPMLTPGGFIGGGGGDQ